MNCPICSKSNHKKSYQLYDDRFGYPGYYDLYICNDSNRRTSWLKGEDANAYAWVPENVTVLDIDCGFGEAVGYHRERGCDAYGVEMDRNTINAIDHYNYNIQIGLFDKNNYTLKSFDYVTLDQVIEHLKDQVKQLNDIHEVLKPEGKLIISTPNYYAFMRRILGKKWLH